MPPDSRDANSSETHIVGPETMERKVSAQECPALAGHHIAHVAAADTAPPFRMVRMDLSAAPSFSPASPVADASCSMAAGGCMRAGDACIAPPHVLLAFHCEPRHRWDITWVRYQQPPDQKPIVQAYSPAMARLDPHCPCATPSSVSITKSTARTRPATVRNWVDIIHTYVLRFASPWQTDDRLGHLWEHVAARLGEPWSLDLLARHCHLSTEHLRRLCRRELGRSPMHHVIFLRMQDAAKLLATTDDKVETIANTVGYANPFVFSTTFKKWVGWRPSEYRARKR